MRTRSVMFSVGLAGLLIAGLPGMSFRGNPAAPAPAEPGAGLDAAATLDSLSGTGSQLTGNVRIQLSALSADQSITLLDRDGRELARTRLARGQQRDLHLSVALLADRDNDVSFQLESRLGDGSVERQALHLMVPLDPEHQPRLVGDSLEYQGAVELAGGGR
jgi:hypothetical protein